ncbi:calcium channel-like protein subunit Cch1 [Trichodelitschia bisporula]|uniref:Calcium-channel protein CCH1 n=1 Tax=Trichodelitschia bisporula TaxID=703511 RepID=A0A6G1HZ20_9PEZI|nr:calcium channel-like protein subunit Cch1 [Trichodelitschia bisporula]
MEFNDPHNRRNSSPPQSIPLQDLSRTPAVDSGGDGESQAGRIRALSDRGRDLWRNRNSPGRGAAGGSYSPIVERDGSPIRPPRGPHLTIPQSSTEYVGGNASPTSPVDAAGFQQAIGGFSGLSFEPAFDAPSFPAHARNTDFLSTTHPSDSDSIVEPEEPGQFSPNTSSDRILLTDPTHLQPISGAHYSDNRGSRSRSVHFTATPLASRARLGDDLAQAESGLQVPGGDMRRRSSSRSLSPSAAGATLQRAGTIMRNMSQRIVNLSNETDVVEKTIKRKTSQRQSGQDGSTSPGGLPTIDGAESQDNIAPEKPPSVQAAALPRRPSKLTKQTNPLKGKSLGIFPPDNPIRMRLCEVLVHPITEPLIFVLIVIQTILLSVDSSRPVKYSSPDKHWNGSILDWCLFALFCIYTVEIISRSIVSGFLINPTEYSTINRQVGLGQAVKAKVSDLFGNPQSRPPPSLDADFHGPQQPSLLRAFTTNMAADQQVMDSRQQQRIRLAHRAFLRHSFNRLDFVAVTSYWISFTLAIFNTESEKHLYVFRMLSCLRILRLLYLTSGTTVILRSLKKAAPLLTNVAFLIGFFWLLFGIIGLQSFKSSLRRTCVWTNPADPSDTYTANLQFCGGWMDQNRKPQPWLQPDGTTPGAANHKGYLCPVNSKCIESQNPYNGSVSFDNIFQSLELVFVIMSSNTFSDIMYYLTNSDYLAAAIFFAFGIVILFFWLVNLLIAVITSSFQVIRDESEASAFTGEGRDGEADNPENRAQGAETRRKVSTLKKMYDKTKWLWVCIIVYGVLVQGLRSASMGSARARFIDGSEIVVTLALDVEIVLRFVTDWRHFVHDKRNLFDTGLAIITSVIQIPSIRHSGQPYAWLTLFQVLRIYRVVLAVPMTRDLIMTVLGNFTGLLNLILFVFLLTFLAAILAAQMFRGTLPQQNSSGETINVTFNNLWNAFLGMYQIFSSENWTTPLYNVTNYDVLFNTAWMGAAFFILWFILANFIVLNMFIAVIQENFDISEDEKRLQQVKAFLEQKELGGSNHGNLSLSTIFKFSLASGRKRDPLAFGSATTEMLLKDAVVKDFLDQQDEPTPFSSPHMDEDTQPILRPAPTAVVGSGTISSWWGSLMSRVWHTEPNPFYSRLEFSRAYEDLDPRQMAKEVMSARERRKRAQREYLRKHPNYNVSLYIFGPRNPIRRFCQRIVGPGRGGDRIDGVAPSVPIWYSFSAFIYASIVAMVLLACITTPLYQKEYFGNQKFSVKNWFVFSDMGFAVLFTIEALIKVIADGFFFTPNAYFRGSWGFIDGVVLITLWINVAAALYSEGQVSRAVGAFKALRALRLLNVSDSARNNFHAVIVRGGIKVMSAAFVSISLLIPFAIYGLNLFVGKLVSCNDGGNTAASGFTVGITDLNDCVGEYVTNSNPSNWNILAPRVASNPYYSFDNFGGSLFILFQVVSQEGWIDVMWNTISITGVFKQPQPFSSYGNAIFFVVFNLLGAVFVLTLFVSVFMRNYTEQTGVAFLTSDQRSWLELRKLLRQISPSKRPLPNSKRGEWKEWCYKRAVKKTGRWQRFVTAVLVCHLILLCVEFYPSKDWWDRTRDSMFFAFILIYTANIVIRIVGLTWARFRKSSWDIYSLISVSAAFTATILVLAQPKSWVIVRLHKLALVSIALLLIPRNNQLDQLFKTAAASLPLILNLLATWFVLFLTFAIALTQTFGLTKFNHNESGNINFRNVPKTLILLFRTSVGEGWNQIMEDFATMRPPYCTVSSLPFDSDCGSAEWARTLFIAWNILSMYIFVNLFVSLIYESFSYVYQRSSGLSVISREEIRRFKQAWAEFDPHGTGYISKEAFPRLLGELSGVFEMRIYDGDWSVARLIEDCSRPRRESGLPVEDGHEPREIDLKKLNRRLAELPVKEIQKRRHRMNKFYEEVLVSSDPDRGISFTSLLMILAHYKVINDNRSLRLHEFLRRRARLQRVDEAVRRNVVIGFFDTVYWSRRFRHHMERKHAGHMTAIPQFTVPEIFVDGEDDGPENEPNAARHSHFSGLGPSSPGPSSIVSSPRTGVMTPPNGPSGATTPAGGSPTRLRRNTTLDDVDDNWQLAAAISRPVSPLNAPEHEGGGRSRAESSVSAQDVLEVLDNSVWGESIRKSFSTRRGEGSGGR